jgi:hypothetical protein
MARAGHGETPEGRECYNLRELAGAFGDLGTLIPFLVGSITIMKLDPVGVLVAFGLFQIIAGLYCKTPMPIQPMKAIGTAAISHAGALTAVGLAQQPHATRPGSHQRARPSRSFCTVARTCPPLFPLPLGEG